MQELPVSAPAGGDSVCQGNRRTAGDSGLPAGSVRGFPPGSRPTIRADWRRWVRAPRLEAVPHRSTAGAFPVGEAPLVHHRGFVDAAPPGSHGAQATPCPAPFFTRTMPFKPVRLHDLSTEHRSVAGRRSFGATDRKRRRSYKSAMSGCLLGCENCGNLATCAQCPQRHPGCHS